MAWILSLIGDPRRHQQNEINKNKYATKKEFKDYVRDYLKNEKHFTGNKEETLTMLCGNKNIILDSFFGAQTDKPILAASYEEIFVEVAAEMAAEKIN